MDRNMKIAAGGAALIGSALLLRWAGVISDPRRLSASVGWQGKNRRSDINLLKDLLGKAGFAFAAKGSFYDLMDGLLLVDAIVNQRFELAPDLTIDRSHQTFKILSKLGGPFWMQCQPHTYGAAVFRPPANLDHTTGWLLSAMENAGVSYEKYRDKNPTSSRMVVTAMSPPRGGAAVSHGRHSTGLACDLLPPRKDGRDTGATKLSEYDQAATRAQMIALRKHDVSRIVFNDADLVAEGLCENTAEGLSPEIHVEIAWRGKGWSYRED